MSAFVIVDTKISDADAYEQYKVVAKPLAEKHGGVYRARGGTMTVPESDLWSPTRMVIIEFPNRAAAEAFYNDPEYQPVKAKRRGASECTLVILDGA